MALMCCRGLRACSSTLSRLGALLSSLVARQRVGFGLCGGSNLGACLLVGWWGPGALAVDGPTRVCLLDFFCSGILFYLLLSPYPFIS